MELLLAAAPIPPPPHPRHRHLRRHNPLNLFPGQPFLSPKLRSRDDRTVRCSSARVGLPAPVPDPPDPHKAQPWWLPSPLRLAAPALLLLASCSVAFSPSARAWTLGSGPLPAQTPLIASEDRLVEDSKLAAEDGEDDVEWRKEFERWKSKTYSLTVPLRVVALRGSLPPAWLKDFFQVQGKRVKMMLEFRGSLESIIGDLSKACRTGQLEPKSAMAADVVSIGDSWLDYAISEGLIEPMEGVEGQDWFRNLSSNWKVYLRRNSKGEIDPCGSIWAAPYRWGCMVIAYKKSKLEKHKLAPIEDWEDLWRPELRGKIVMIDSPREVIGLVLKCMGASYNTKDINLQVHGGMSTVKQKLTMFQQQVRLFDGAHYLKAFGTADAWIAVGWSSDVLPVAKRMSNVTVIVPTSGSSLWADLWAIPAATKRFQTDKIGGRIRGPSPLIHQWIEFCLQPARASHFQQGLLPGASPASLEYPPMCGSQETSKGKPKLETNLICGVPPPEIIGKCEFLEPLSEETLADYRTLLSNMQMSRQSWISNAQHYLSSLVEKVGLNIFPK